MISRTRLAVRESWFLIIRPKKNIQPNTAAFGSHCCRYHSSVNCETNCFRRQAIVYTTRRLGLDFIFDEYNYYDHHGTRISSSESGLFQNKPSCKTFCVKIILSYEDSFLTRRQFSYSAGNMQTTTSPRVTDLSLLNSLNASAGAGQQSASLYNLVEFDSVTKFPKFWGE